MPGDYELIMSQTSTSEVLRANGQQEPAQLKIEIPANRCVLAKRAF